MEPNPEKLNSLSFGIDRNPETLERAMLAQEAGVSIPEKLGNFWIGSDVGLEGQAVVIQPGEHRRDLKIILNKQNLPPIEVNQGSFGHLQWSVRSFLAQSGININIYRENLTREMVQAIEKGEEVPFPIDLENLGQRAIEIEGRVMRFFWVNEKNRLRGEKLREIIGKDLVIEGEEGKDWFLGDTEWEEREPAKRFPIPPGSREVCVIVPLSDKKLYIPHDPEPLRPRDNKNRLKDILQPIPEGVNLDFEIGETPHIKLGPDIVAVIPTGGYDGGAHHIRSPLIDPGSDWPIRTETKHGMDFIELFIYRNKQK